MQIHSKYIQTATPSHGTGPSQPHKGRYAYIETSSPRKEHDIADLITDQLAPSMYIIWLLY